MSETLCQACAAGNHEDCGRQTWCECDCDPDQVIVDDVLRQIEKDKEDYPNLFPTRKNTP